MTASEMSRIERRVLIRAPRGRVWRAITKIEEFSKWFGVDAEGEFTPGARLRMTSTMAECKGEVFYINVEEMTPERVFSWRWHPGMAQPNVDYSREPTTLVEFRLEEVADGTLVTVVETGFDKISLTRRAKVFEENEGGWKYQMAALEQYVGKTP